ncbi:hypothetical protein [Solibacillus sp. CAU 1738]|uniref:hypothetical protein n=1 Tax=Solibacillus sp. CAU 1738 TaxID=3140363 RepID=UPI003260F79B
MKGSRNEGLKNGFNMFFSPYLEGYRNRVNELYADEYRENRESFFFMNPVKLHVLLNDMNTHLVLSENDVDQIGFIDCKDMQHEEFSVLRKGPEKLKIEFIKSEFSITEYITDFHYYDLGEYAGLMFNEVNHGGLIERSKVWGIENADSHEMNYRFNKALQSAFEPSTLLSDLNTDLIIEKVNTPSFAYEFGESVKAYNAGIYLAASTTGGIALENILRILIKNKTSEHLPKDTYIKDSLAVLKRNHVLSNRLAASVSNLRDIRNSNSHTNEDPVRKTTVDHLYATIEDLAMLL